VTSHIICRVRHARRTLCLLRILTSQAMCQHSMFHCIVKKESRNVNNVSNLNTEVRRSRLGLTTKKATIDEKYAGKCHQTTQ
jgi:hypothetical protein